MILAAALLVLVALGLFVGGILTGLTAMYWACVAVSAVAAVLLILARRQLSRPAPRDRATTERRDVSTGPEPTSVLPVESSGEPAARPFEPVPAQPLAPPVQYAPRTVPPAAEPERVPGAQEEAPADSQHIAPEPEHTPAEPEQVPEPPIAPSEEPASVARHASPADGGSARSAAGGDGGDPPVEEVEVTDLLLVVDLHDDVLVVDEHPRYHLPECSFLTGRTGIPLPMDEARMDGFTPCGLCSPDRHLAERERARRASRRST